MSESLTLQQKLELYELLKEKERRQTNERRRSYAPYARQMEFHAAGAQFRERLFMAGNQLGKAVINGTRVMTPDGWAKVEDLRAGDYVIAGDGLPTMVLGVFPQGVRDIYKLTFDYGEEIFCCEDHLWKYQHPQARFRTYHSRGEVKDNRRFGEWSVAPLKQIVAEVGTHPSPKRRVVMPFCGVVQRNRKDVPIDPYVIGLLLGDGHLKAGCSITKGDAEVHQAFHAELAKHGITWRKGGISTRANIGNHWLTDALKDLGLYEHLSYQKFVPEVYKHNDADTRLALLQGLMDTDGSCDDNGAIEYSSSSEQLAKDVLELVQSFGGKGRIVTRQTSYTYKGERKQGRVSYRVHIRLPHVPPFRLQRKIDKLIRPESTTDYRVLYSIQPAGRHEATCIAVAHPDHTFVIEHGIVTHNTMSAAQEIRYHLTGEYPAWWQGIRFDDRAPQWWAGSKSSQMVREGLQRLLFGIGGSPGFIPEELIVKTSVVPNSGGMIDEAYIKHRCGGISRLAFKSYDQGRERWQAGTVDGIAFDEEPPEDIYMEGITRTNATNGPVMLTFTPLQGMSNVVKRFLLDVSSEGAKYRNVTRMTIYDVDHYTDEERARIIATYPEHERKARTMGEPSLGAGAIFPINEEVLKVSPFAIPHHWKRIVGIDFGWNHPFAAAWLAYDADTDTIYVTDCYKVREATPIIHAATIKAKGDWIPVSWPHDGLQHDKGSGDQLAEQYRKQGLNMLRERATFPDGSNSVEAGIMDMLDRMQTGRFKVFSHLEQWFQEFRMYHRDENGRIVKVDDDVLSATRYASMMLRFAKTYTPRVAEPRVDPFMPLDRMMGM